MEVPKEILEAREKYQSIQITCPTLDVNLQPQPILEYRPDDIPNCDGDCYKCDSFMGYWSEDGTVFAHNVYEGFCDCKTTNIIESVSEEDSYEDLFAYQEKEFRFLDSKDLSEFFVQGADISDIMQQIEDKYGSEYTEEEFIFNCIDISEFIDYLVSRYNISFYEETVYKLLKWRE